MRRPAGVYKRGKIYWINYRWQGHQYFESSHSADIRDAEALLGRKKAELFVGVAPTRPSQILTMNELLNKYITQIPHAATQKRYRLSQKALSPQYGRIRITEIDAFMLDRFKEARRNQGVSAAGVNRDLGLVRAALNFAVQRRLLAHSPFDGVKLLNEAKDRKPPRIINFAEEHKLLLCCDLRLRTVVVTILETGMRIGIEALRLKWVDIDFEELIINVTNSKTTAGIRSLPMTPLVRSELLKWQSATKGISEYVFFNGQRPDTHIQSVKTAWHNALKLAGISRFPIYQCRHVFATRLAAAGVSDTIIDQLLGHSRRDVLRFYTARVPEYLRDAMTRLDRVRSAKTDHGMPRISGVAGNAEKSSILLN